MKCFIISLILFFLGQLLLAQSKIDFNYDVNNHSETKNEIVFKVLLKPQQSLYINYMDRFFKSQTVNFFNRDTISAFIVKKINIDNSYAKDATYFTYFEIISVRIDKNSLERTEYNFSAIQGDSILIDNTKKPLHIDAKRLYQGQMNYYVNYINDNPNFKIDKVSNCDSVYYYQLFTEVNRILKKTQDSVSMYEGDFSLFKKSQGYIKLYKLQNYSISIELLFGKLIENKKLDSCYSLLIKNFQPIINEFFKDSLLIFTSRQYCSALYDIITYKMVENNMDITTSSAFKIIDLIAKGYYQKALKIMYLNNEIATKENKCLALELINEEKYDTNLISKLKKISLFNKDIIALYKNNILRNGQNKLTTLQETLSKINEDLILIDFWASWCKPCIEEFAIVKKIKKIKVIYISLDDDFSKWKHSAKINKIPFSGSYKLEIAKKKIFLKSLDIISLPHFILLNKNGEILNSNMPRPSEKLKFEKSYQEKK